MASLIPTIVSGLSTVGSVAGQVGKGFLSQAGQSAGLGQIFKPAMTDVLTKSPKTGLLSQVAAAPSVWSKIGSALGEQAMKGGEGTSSSSSFPSTDASTRVSQSRGYQGKKKQTELERLLEELSMRR